MKEFISSIPQEILQDIEKSLSLSRSRKLKLNFHVENVKTQFNLPVGVQHLECEFNLIKRGRSMMHIIKKNTLCNSSNSVKAKTQLMWLIKLKFHYYLSSLYSIEGE